MTGSLKAATQCVQQVCRRYGHTFAILSRVKRCSRPMNWHILWHFCIIATLALSACGIYSRWALHL